MTYATQQDLIERFGSQELIQLTDRTNKPVSTIDVTTVERALSDAEALINGYVGKMYTIPLSPVPPVLTKVAADIARYYLHGTRAEKDSPITLAFNQAVAWLKDVARGQVNLGDDTGDVPEQSGGGAVLANPSSRVFTRDSLRGS